MGKELLEQEAEMAVLNGKCLQLILKPIVTSATIAALDGLFEMEQAGAIKFPYASDLEKLNYCLLHNSWKDKNEKNRRIVFRPSLGFNAKAFVSRVDHATSMLRMID